MGFLPAGGDHATLPASASFAAAKTEATASGFLPSMAEMIPSLLYLVLPLWSMLLPSAEPLAEDSRRDGRVCPLLLFRGRVCPLPLFRGADDRAPPLLGRVCPLSALRGTVCPLSSLRGADEGRQKPLFLFKVLRSAPGGAEGTWKLPLDLRCPPPVTNGGCCWSWPSFRTRAAEVDLRRLPSSRPAAASVAAPPKTPPLSAATAQPR